MATSTEEPHLIFLSHSGQEKPFVERLDRALRSAGHDPFLDKISLPLGEKFPAHILNNARKSKLGVVVLSPGFLTSKWPMIELHAMHTYKPRPTILPLFLAVRPDDIKPSSPTFCKWKNAWPAFEKNDPDRIKTIEWESALTSLSSIHGVVYQQGMTEEQFIAKVVWAVSSIVRPLLRYDVSHLIGHERITQVVADLFETAPKAPHRALGFYGIGGLGKTAACKLMINHYGRDYLGRCALIEFPSTGCTKEIVAMQCDAALERLAQPQADDLPSTHKRDDLDECLERLRKRGATGRDVFIAIDNVWDDSLKFVQRVLDIGFSSGSTVMVTSRSMPVLLNLLKDKRCVKPLPGLTEDEACKLFEDAFRRNQGVRGVELEGASVQNVTKSLCYGGVFHPLAINAAGTSLGRFGGEAWEAAWDSKKPLSFTGSGSDTDKAIKLNFDSIPRSRQDTFLDVALIYIPEIQQSLDFEKWLSSLPARQDTSYWPAFYSMLLRAWLAAVDPGVMDIAHESSAALEQLAYDGLLEFDGSQVHVHDLYKDMASRAAQASHRFALPSGDSSSSRGINPAEVERMVCEGTRRQTADILASVKASGSVSKLRVLLVKTFLEDWKVVRMLEMRVLQVRTAQLKFQREGWRMRQGGWGDYMPNLAWLHLEVRGGDLQTFHLDKAMISSLRNLRVLILDGGDEYSWTRLNIDDDLTDVGMSRIVRGAVNFCLEGLVSLQILSIRRVEDLGEISGLESLENLEHVSVILAPSLLKVGKFRSCSKKLQCVVFDQCSQLKEVVGISNLESLRQLCLRDVRVLPDLMAMAALEGLSLGMPSAAVRVNQGLPNLTRLWLGGHGYTVEEIGGLPRLKELFINGCEDKVLKLSRLRNLPHLERLFIVGCNKLREIEWSSLNDLANLQILGILYCPSLQRLRGEPAGMNHTLRHLSVKFCTSFKEIGGRHLLSESCTVQVVGSEKQSNYMAA